jgi:hypothetical protein
MPTSTPPQGKVLPPTEALTQESQVQSFTATMALAFHQTPTGPNPLTTAFTTEIDQTPPPYPSPTISSQRFTAHFYRGIHGAFASGATLLCSPSIAHPSAVALWEPPHFQGVPFDQLHAEPGPILREWQLHTARMRAEYVGETPFWHLGFLGRNPSPDVERVAGAVSALVLPVLERCRREGVVAWLEATSESAVSVYEHFGFRVCEVVRLGVGRVSETGWPEEGGKGERAWGMIFDGHLEGAQ